jgi:hypothetical protein
MPAGEVLQPFLLYQNGLTLFTQAGLTPQYSNLHLPYAGILGMLHHAWLFLWDKVSLTFLPWLALNCDPTISASQVGGFTTDTYHHSSSLSVFISFGQVLVCIFFYVLLKEVASWLQDGLESGEFTQDHF